MRTTKIHVDDRISRRRRKHSNLILKNVLNDHQQNVIWGQKKHLRQSIKKIVQVAVMVI